MSVCYLDPRDEITDAVARLRAAPDDRVIVVLPAGSRIGTSRINFRLLLREAETRGIALDLVSDEPGVRALAISAGMRAYGNVAEAERGGAPEPFGQPLLPAAFRAPSSDAFQPGQRSASGPRAAAGDGPPSVSERATGGLAATTSATAASAAGSGASGVRRGSNGSRRRPAPAEDPRWTRTETGTFAVMPRGANVGPGLEGAGGAWTGDAGSVPRRGRSRARRRVGRAVGWAIRLAVLLGIVTAVAYAAYAYLPTATISLKPGTQPFGPVTFTITADPNVAVADPAAGRIPAQHWPIPLAETATFPATGRDVSQTRAQGIVTFTSTNTFFDVPIPDGTPLATPAGTQFVTAGAAVLPKASINAPSRVEVAIRAAVGGPAGNVPAGAISVAPKSISDLLVTVTNAQPTTGGRRSETGSVTRADYDAAIAQLTQKLNADLQTAIADPATAPRGLTIYPATATLGRVTASAAAGDLVGTKVSTFDLTVDAQGSVLAVDEALIASVAGKKLIASAPVGVRIFPETLTTQLSTGTVSGTTVTYQVMAQARQYQPVDPAQLEELVRGKTLSEARSILQPYGTAAVSIWPDFVPTIPTDVRRINLTIENPEIPR